ncbi:unnamed protein product [Rotaria sp. Silwood1]|nr:unnamed protein product [Rotaria sp. Silwood1]CAF1266187.1 unnamed protein product [Rotaria sp. Silwood1]CAF3537149.1 unnamed protein product [Rotaria sp. Silwood1]CAF4973332.1 unnamed protein product [Rotaria sp. Silwood1]
MRPAYAGPGSAGSRWKPTQDPGKLAGTSNSGGNRTSGTDANSASKGGNVQHVDSKNCDDIVDNPIINYSC